jgi:hypothetical protein
MHTYDMTNIHGSTVVNRGLNLFDTNILRNGDVLAFPMLYRVTFNGQSRPDFYRVLAEIQSYTCCRDFNLTDK